MIIIHQYTYDFYKDFRFYIHNSTEHTTTTFTTVTKSSHKTVHEEGKTGLLERYHRCTQFSFEGDV